MNCPNVTAPWGSTLERFMSRIDTRPDDPEACWIWRGGRDSALTAQSEVAELFREKVA